MIEAAEVAKTAMLLPEDERAKLASQLLGSLPSMLHDDDEGVAEARRRDIEFECDPSSAMTLSEFQKSFEK